MRQKNRLIPAQTKKRGRPTTVDLSDAPEWKVRLNEILIEKELSYAAASIGAGIDKTSISKYFKDNREPTLPHLERLCDFLGISIEWLVRGTGLPYLDSSEAGLQKVPVIAWRDIGAHIEGRGCEMERTLMLQAVQSSERRFVLNMSGSSMSPTINSGDEIDCAPSVKPQPDDVVIAWVKGLGEYVCRQLDPVEFRPDGAVMSAKLVASGKGWSAIDFDHKRGDRIVAVVIGVTRRLRRLQ